MDTAALEAAYRRILDLAETTTFRDPPPGQWGAETVLAHVAATDELIVEAVRAVLAGTGQARYDNAAALPAENLGGQDMSVVVDRLQTSSRQLVDVASQLDDAQAATEIPVRIVDGDSVATDGPMPIGRLVANHAEHHLAEHLSQLQALRARP